VIPRRRERLAEEVREEVARILGEEVKDPRVGFVTVTRVELTPDLRLARVFVGVLGDAGARQATMRALLQAAGFVRRALGRRLAVRFTPEVQFVYDKGLDAADRVARLLRETEAAEPSGREDEGGGEE
jgi:ribosome-binding factor A